MTVQNQTRCTAFEGPRRIASGELSHVAFEVKQVLDRGERAPVLIFSDQTSQVIEVDFRGTPDEVLSRLSAAAGKGGSPNGTECRPEPSADAVAATPASAPNNGASQAAATRRPGRPKLGVVGKEVTLLPRHWDWLNSQPGGASVALRKLVEEARRVNQTKDRVRQAQEAAYRFMSAMAGNEQDFEEATRALFAGKKERFEQMIDTWPIDVRDHAKMLAEPALADNNAGK